MPTILITWANRWMGFAWVQKFLSMGRNVIATSRSGKIDIEDPKLINLQLDLSQAESIKNASTELHDKQVKIDILYNNAGILLYDDNLDVDRSGLEQTLNTNLIWPIDFTEQIKDLIPNSWKIIFASSMSASFDEIAADGVYPPYRMSKVAINMYVHTLAIRLKEKNISVIALDPGRVNTDMGWSLATTTKDQVADYIWWLANNQNLKSWWFYFEWKLRDW